MEIRKEISEDMEIDEFYSTRIIYMSGLYLHERNIHKVIDFVNKSISYCPRDICIYIVGPVFANSEQDKTTQSDLLSIFKMIIGIAGVEVVIYGPPIKGTEDMPRITYVHKSTEEETSHCTRTNVFRLIVWNKNLEFNHRTICLIPCDINAEQLAEIVEANQHKLLLIDNRNDAKAGLGIVSWAQNGLMHTSDKPAIGVIDYKLDLKLIYL